MLFMQIETREERTDFGKVWYIEDIDKSFRFAIYRYDDDLDTIYLSNVFVNEQFRKRGLGNIILQMTNDIAKKLLANTICLKVKEGTFVHFVGKGDSNTIEFYCKDNEEIGFMWMRKDV